MSSSLPTAGFVRLVQIIGQKPVTAEEAAANRAAGRPNQYPRPGIVPVIPVSAAAWWRGVRSGLYPKPVKCGRTTFWRVESIRTLIEQIVQDGCP